jgi:hypothetical protein
MYIPTSAGLFSLYDVIELDISLDNSSFEPADRIPLTTFLQKATIKICCNDSKPQFGFLLATNPMKSVNYSIDKSQYT